MPATGRCLCGAVTFTAERVEPTFTACHCNMCTRWSAGTFFSVRAHGVTFAASSPVGRYDSSSWAERGFCTTCGTVLFYAFKGSGSYAMSVGVFDDPAQFPLASEIFIDRKLPGFSLSGDHARLTEAEVFAKYAPKS